MNAESCLLSNELTLQPTVDGERAADVSDYQTENCPNSNTAKTFVAGYCLPRFADCTCSTKTSRYLGLLKLTEHICL